MALGSTDNEVIFCTQTSSEADQRHAEARERISSKTTVSSLVQNNRFPFNRYRRKRRKGDANIFDSALIHTRRWDASEKKKKKIACPLLDVSACGQVSSPRLYRLKCS